MPLVVLLVLGVVLFLFGGYRWLFKRIVLLAKIKKECKKRGYELEGLRPLFLFSGNRREKSDFFIRSAKNVYSVKLFGVRKKTNTLVFTEDGMYYYKYRVFFASVFPAIFNLTSTEKKLPVYSFYTDEQIYGERRALKSVLLVNPVCMEIRYKDRSGGEKILGAGQSVNGVELQTLSKFIDKLEEEAGS